MLTAPAIAAKVKKAVGFGATHSKSFFYDITSKKLFQFTDNLVCKVSIDSYRKESETMELIRTSRKTNGSPIPLYAVLWEHSGSQWLYDWGLMKKLDVSLEQYVKQNSKVTLQFAENFCWRLVTTVIALHECKVIHGDMHIANIMLDGMDDAWVIDFDHAIHVSDVKKNTLYTRAIKKDWEFIVYDVMYLIHMNINSLAPASTTDGKRKLTTMLDLVDPDHNFVKCRKTARDIVLTVLTRVAQEFGLTDNLDEYKGYVDFACSEESYLYVWWYIDIVSA